MRWTACRPLKSVIAVAALLLGGCREPPEAVLDQARDALAEVNRTSCNAKDQLDEALAALGQHLEPRSAALLRSAPQVERQSAGQFKVFATCKPPPSILPSGEVVQVETAERTAKVSVQVKGRKAHVVVPMVLVEGRWKVALIDMDSFTRAVAVQ